MITCVKVEKFEPFGKAFCSQHPFANVPNQEDKNETVSLSVVKQINDRL